MGYPSTDHANKNQSSVRTYKPLYVVDAEKRRAHMRELFTERWFKKTFPTKGGIK